MNEDTKAALKWLVGNEDKSPQEGFPSPGRAALIRLLRSPGPLASDLRNALANALEPLGSSKMKLVLGIEHRGKGRPRGGARGAFEKQLLGAAIEAEPTEKVDFKVLDATAKAGKSKSSGYAAKSARKRARELPPE